MLIIVTNNMAPTMPTTITTITQVGIPGSNCVRLSPSRLLSGSFTGGVVSGCSTWVTVVDVIVVGGVLDIVPGDVLGDAWLGVVVDVVNGVELGVVVVCVVVVVVVVVDVVVDAVVVVLVVDVVVLDVVGLVVDVDVVGVVSALTSIVLPPGS